MQIIAVSTSDCQWQSHGFILLSVRHMKDIMGDDAIRFGRRLPWHLYTRRLHLEDKWRVYLPRNTLSCCHGYLQNIHENQFIQTFWWHVLSWGSNFEFRMNLFRKFWISLCYVLLSYIFMLSISIERKPPFKVTVVLLFCRRSWQSLVKHHKTVIII